MRESDIQSRCPVAWFDGDERISVRWGLIESSAFASFAICRRVSGVYRASGAKWLGKRHGSIAHFALEGEALND